MGQLTDYLATRALSFGLLTAAGAETVHDTTVQIDYVINGVGYSKTAITDGATPTTDYVTGAAFPALVGGNSVANTPGQGTVIVFALNAAGAVKCMQGSIEALDMSGNFIRAPQFPPVPEDVCPFAYMVLKAGATAAVSNIFGTTNWNATGYTNVIKNISELPDRPVVS